VRIKSSVLKTVIVEGFQRERLLIFIAELVEQLIDLPEDFGMYELSETMNELLLF
jgi:hypothetical protein